MINTQNIMLNTHSNTIENTNNNNKKINQHSLLNNIILPNNININTYINYEYMYSYFKYIYNYFEYIYSYFKYIYNNILIINEYTINNDDDLITQAKCFILRYRRIIGIILLCSLLYIDFTYSCDNKKIFTKIHIMSGGGDGPPPAGDAGSPPLTPPPLTPPNNNGKNPPQTPTKNGDDAGSALKPKTQNNNAKNPSQKPKKTGDDAGSSLKSKIKNSATAKLSQPPTPSKFKNALASMGKKISNAPAYAGEKFKDFSGVLYQFLFSVAIFIAICLIILPSLSFIIIGIICYFLFKKKMASFKNL